MQKEPPDNGMAENETGNVSAGASSDEISPPCEEIPQEIARPDDEQTNAKAGDGDDNLPEKEQPADADTGHDENRVEQFLNDTSAGILNGVSGKGNKIYNKYSNHYHSHSDVSKNLEPYINNQQLHSSKRSYKSLHSSNIAAYTGILLTHRILLLSCYNKDVALNIAKSIAYENKAASKQLVTIETNCQGTYTFKSLIEQLAPPKENNSRTGKRASQRLPSTICVWAANDISESDIGDISSTILDSLFIGNAYIEQYQTQLTDYGLCLICLISPRKLQDYKRSSFEVDLQNWDIDFLRPLLEDYGLEQYEELAETIARQRQQGLWSADDAEFYKEIGRYLREKNLPEIVADRPQHGRHDDLGVQQLFDLQDPLIDTVLYCATYYPDLSPQDFSHLVELSLDDVTEEVIRKIDQSQPQNGDEKDSPVEAVPLVRRWRRETDAILRRCKLAPLTNEDNRRVVDFQVDGLRNRLGQYIQSDHYFFYESNFVLMRRQGFLFSPKRKIAEGARQLLVDMAKQYAPNEVANWLYEIVAEFEHMAQAAVYLPGERPQLFRLLPDGHVRAARHHVCQGLSLVLSRINKEPELQEAARLFWQRLLQTQRQWFLDLLRQMGNSAPAESLNLLKQLLDQSPQEIRQQAGSYLVGYLLRRDSLIYPTLKELMQWSKATQAGRTAQTLFIIYCLETNRQLAQQDYGRWPSLHPLFGFQSRAEAIECLDLLIIWLFSAASEVDEDNTLFAVADIVAGWYFILSSPSQPEARDAATLADGLAELDAQSVRQLLLEHLAQYVSRPQKNGLLEIWDTYKHGILDEVFRLDKFTNTLAAISLDVQLMTDAATARRKLIDTRNLLNQLRRDFIHCAATVLQD
jgi:hypothetical protein